MKKLLIIITTLGLVALVLVAGTAAFPTDAADHLDAPGLTSPGGDSRLDINDVYAFQSPANPAHVVLIMTVNPAAGALNPTTFHPDASYEFKIETNGKERKNKDDDKDSEKDDDKEDAKEDLTYKVTFSAPDNDRVQNVMLRRVPSKGKGGAVLARGQTGRDISVKGGGMLRTGLFDDPFFFDLNAFLGSAGRKFCDGNETNFFLDLNVSAIVLEVPSDTFGNKNIGVWARTELKGKQIDRMGRPAINTVFIPNNPFEPVGTEPSLKNSFNAGKPKHDQRDFRAEVVDTLEIFYGTGNPTVGTLADILLPDILTIDTSSAEGFLNGRRLEDDVIDDELELVTNRLVTKDCVENDSAFSGAFPYLAPPN